MPNRLLTTAYEVALMRAFHPLADAYGVDRPSRMGPANRLAERTYTVRQAYQWINSNLPRAAVVQHNPDVTVDIHSGLYANRQTVAVGDEMGILFGIDQASYDALATDISQVFSAGRASEPADVNRLCDRYTIDALLVKDTDPAWNDRQSWVWQHQPAFGNDYVRVFACGDLASDPNSITD